MISSNRRRNQQAAAAVIAEEMEYMSDIQAEDKEIPKLSLESKELKESKSSRKFKTSVTNILSKHCSEVKNASDDIIQTTVNLSKKKLKELVHKHNNKIFSFMDHPDKTTNILGIAENVFKKYNHESPNTKLNNNVLTDLNLDVSINNVIKEFDEELDNIAKHDTIHGGLHIFTNQLRWIFHEYKNIGEEIIKLETLLYEKLDHLDKLHHRIPLIMTLTNNQFLPELIDIFTKYTESLYQDMMIEEDYKNLIEAYKKWNVCRQIISLQNIVKQDTHEPQCSICLIEPISFVIVPCGHTFCTGCSKKQNNTCYICRGGIKDRVKLYFT